MTDAPNVTVGMLAPMVPELVPLAKKIPLHRVTHGIRLEPDPIQPLGRTNSMCGARRDQPAGGGRAHRMNEVASFHSVPGWKVCTSPLVKRLCAIYRSPDEWASDIIPA